MGTVFKFLVDTLDDDDYPTLNSKLDLLEDRDDSVIHVEYDRVSSMKKTNHLSGKSFSYKHRDVYKRQPSDRITHSEGLKAIETAVEYIGQQEEVTPAYIICLCKWKDIAARKLMRGKKQVSITDFFKP